MSMGFLTGALLATSLVTNITVEGLKKILDSSNKAYSANVLAVIISVIIALAISIGYMIMNDITFTAKVIVETVVLMYLSFLTATVGYDKVVQMISQIKILK